MPFSGLIQRADDVATQEFICDCAEYIFDCEAFRGRPADDACIYLVMVRRDLIHGKASMDDFYAYVDAVGMLTDSLSHRVGMMVSMSAGRSIRALVNVISGMGPVHRDWAVKRLRFWIDKPQIDAMRSYFLGYMCSRMTSLQGRMINYQNMLEDALYEMF